jgi:glycosyltransferase involved in cell wall biosynthesis
VRISILIHNVYGVGGTNRTVFNLAEGLVQRGHRVEVVSVLRRLDVPMLPVPAGVEIVPLVDLRPGRSDRDDPRARELSAIVPADEEFFRWYSRLTDERVADHLTRSKADVVIGTRPSLNLYVARHADPGAVRIAQEHMTQSLVPPAVHEQMRRHYAGLDAIVTVTEADAGAVRRDLATGDITVRAIPNSVPAPAIRPADGRSRTVVAAGRLDEIKRYDLLVQAFAKVTAERPDWRLRIYGAGGQFRPLVALIADLGLQNHVLMMGSYSPLEAEWVKGSIAAVTSDHESFGMTIVEAMRCGVPVVSTACPVGPAEIITDGVDGVLVTPGDVDAIAAGLLSLINDDDLRVRLGAAALDGARRYDPALVAGQHEALFSELMDRRGKRPARASTTQPARGGKPKWNVTDARGRLRRLRESTERLLRSTPAQPPTADVTMSGNRITVSAPGARDLTHLAFRSRTDKRRFVRMPLSQDPADRDPADRDPVDRDPVDRDPSRPESARVTAAFDADGPLLDEGRWDLFLQDRRGRHRRLKAGLLDVRGLLGGCADVVPFVRNVPYRTKDGFLAVATWRRDRHAELDALSYGLDTITVRGRLIGSTFAGATPELVLNRRGDHARTVVVAGTSEHGTDFAFDLPPAALSGVRLERHEDWDAEVRAAGEPDAAVLALLTDDIIERKTVYAYPPVRVDDDPPLEMYEETPATEVRVKPYLTLASGLSFLVTDREP